MASVAVAATDWKLPIVVLATGCSDIAVASAGSLEVAGKAARRPVQFARLADSESRFPSSAGAVEVPDLVSRTDSRSSM